MKCVFSLLIIGCLLAQNSDRSGIRVISAGEGWSLDGQSLARGDKVSGVSSVTGRPHADGLILECGKKGWLAHTCGNTSCRTPVCSDKNAQRVDQAASGPHETERLPSTFSSLLGREPREVVTLGVRAAGVADGLAVEDAQGVHWEPVLGRLLHGPHCFYLSALPLKPSDDPKHFMTNWRHSDTSGIASVPNLRPGLYAIAEAVIGSNGVCTKENGARTAWVLVIAPVDSVRLTPEWKRASSRLDRLAEIVTPGVVSTVRRALLAYWADNLSTH